MHHDGDLTITEDNAHLYTDLTSVVGCLYIHALTTLPVLTSVGGSLVIRAAATLPALTSVGGRLSICALATLPMLTSVGGSLVIRASITITITMPMLTSVGGRLSISASTTLPALTTAHGVTGRLLCISAWGLWLSDDGLYYAGCRGPLTREAALAHWDRPDERAVMFTAAILAP
jgi:hypothetical protein